MMGPNYRADMWAALESDATLSTTAWPEKPMVLLQPLGTFDATSCCYLLVGELLLQSPRKNLVASIRARFPERSQSQAGKRSEHELNPCAHQNFAPLSDLIARARPSIKNWERPAEDYATHQRLNAPRLSHNGSFPLLTMTLRAPPAFLKHRWFLGS
jgi:hypothetical protein